MPQTNVLARGTRGGVGVEVGVARGCVGGCSSKKPGVSTTRDPTSRTEMVTSSSWPFDLRYCRNLLCWHRRGWVGGWVGVTRQQAIRYVSACGDDRCAGSQIKRLLGERVSKWVSEQAAVVVAALQWTVSPPGVACVGFPSLRSRGKLTRAAPLCGSRMSTFVLHREHRQQSDPGQRVWRATRACGGDINVTARASRTAQKGKGETRTLASSCTPTATHSLTYCFRGGLRKRFPCAAAIGKCVGIALARQ
jgi:hypothetical protein